MSDRQLVSFIEVHLDFGVTTVDHADIYGGYECEAAFGEALNWHLTCVNGWKSSVNAVSRRPHVKKNVIGDYITDRNHIIKSAEQSLINLATIILNMLLIHRPDPLIDADEVADALERLHQSGKPVDFGV
ncbi:aldo/keto reductase [Escherichia coli]